MKNTHPIILIPDTNGYTVYIPDFDIYTQGNDVTEAITMSRDAIKLVSDVMKDDNKTIPTPSKVDDIKIKNGELLNFVDVDLT